MDLKVFSALGVFGTAALTALTAQNTEGVLATWEVPLPFLLRQIEAVLSDLPVGAAKTGMLSSAEIVGAVAGVLRTHLHGPLVVDPVMAAGDGSRLLSEPGVAALRDQLLPLATIVTPNLPEAEALAGMTIRDQKEMGQAAQKIREQGASWVLIKGGHQRGEVVTDLLVGPEGEQAISAPRIPGRHHGTGCALSAAICAFLAQGLAVPEAVLRSHRLLRQLIQNARRLGRGALVLHPSVIVQGQPS